VLAIGLPATSLAPIALADAGSQQSPDQPGPPPPPPLAPQDRQELAAPTQGDGNPNPPVFTPTFSPDPQSITDGLSPDLSASTTYNDVYAVNGTDHLLQVSSEPLNYQAPDGSLVPIDNTLVNDGEQGLENAANVFTVQFPDTLSASSTIDVQMTKGSYSFFPLGADPTSTKATAGDSSVTYPNVFTDTSLTYDPTNAGYGEKITLNSASAPSSITFYVTSGTLTFRQETTGDVSVLSAGQVVATIPAPQVTDSSSPPAEGSAFYTLTDLGGGASTLAVTVDPSFLASATYPVVIDPPQVTLTVDRDGWTSSSCGTCTHESDSELEAGNPGDGSTRYGYLNFYVGNYVRANRIVEAAQASLYSTYVASSSTQATVKRITASWPANPPGLSSGNAPSVGTTVYGTATGGLNHWYSFDLTSLYQNILDSNIGWTNYGVRVNGDANASPITNNYKRFASAETIIQGGQPQLYLYYDDLPPGPTLVSPTDGTVFNYSSPKLKVDGSLTDPNGDDVDVNYQISDDGVNWTGSHLVASSGWQAANDGWIVPAGVLHDGGRYYWRAQSWDVCDPSTGGMCPLMGHAQPTSVAVRSFTIALNHYGAQDRRPMWDDPLGNGMDLKVNEGSGNLYLHLPVDSLQTPVGPLDVGLAYNSEDPADNGLGPGWTIAAGPDSSPELLPSKLTSISGGDSVRITMADGDQLFFPQLDKSSYSTYYASSGAGSGSVKENSDGTFLYTSQDGSQYSFDTSGNLTAATPETSTNGVAGLTYTFSTKGHLRTVTDPLGRAVTFTWDANDDQMIGITTSGFGNHTWTFSSTAGHLQSVTDPEQQTVSFSYGTNGDMTQVTDGDSKSVIIHYTSPAAPVLPQVSSVKDPDTPDATTFAYNGTMTGQLTAQAVITGPRGNAPGAPANTYQTTVDVDTNGLPIKITGPTEPDGSTPPVTTMQWDTNGNLLCQRGAAAHAYALHCTASDTPGTSYHLSTEYAYQSQAPYLLTSLTAPAPDLAGNGTRGTHTYNYDEGLNGLYEEKFENAHLSGVPAVRALDGSSPVNHDWGTGAPEGITGTDYFSVRWTGYLVTTAYHKFHFRLYSDDGATLIVGNRILTDCFGNANAYANYNCNSGSDSVMALWPGTHPITVQYSELTQSAHVSLQWDSGTGAAFGPIPASKLVPNLNLLTSETDQRAMSTTYAYPTGGAFDYGVHHLPNTVTVSGSGVTSRTTTYTYDDYGRILTDQNAAGTIANTYYPDGLHPTASCLVKQVDRAGGETDFTCGPDGDVTAVTRVIAAVDTQPAQSRTTTTVYDTIGRAKTVTYPDASYTQNTYDGAGYLVEFRDRMGRLTDYVYDGRGNVLTKTLPDPDGAGPLTRPSYSYLYDDDNDRTQETDARNKVWTWTYDARDRVTSATDPLSNVAATAYDDTGTATGGTVGVPAVTATSPAGVAAVAKFDVLGRKTSAQVASLGATAYGYDPAGDVTQVTDPAGVWRQTAYDPYGEPVTITTPSDQNGVNAVTNDAYDTAGRLVSVQDPNNHTTAYGYDGDGRITTVTPAGSAASWHVDYDAAGEMAQVRDPDGRIRDWSYDPAHDTRTYTEHPVTGTNLQTTYHDNADGTVASVDDPRGITLTYTYDGMGRQTARSAVKNAQTVDAESFGYDQGSEMTSASETANTPANVALTYDGAGDLKTTVQNGVTATYAYVQGRVTSVAVTGVGTTSYTYDSAGRLWKLTDPFTNQALTVYGYDDAGKVISRTDPAGVTTARGYDQAGQLSTETFTQAGSQVGSYTASYDPGGNVTDLTQSLTGNADSGHWHYTYDAQDRLQTAAPPTGSTLTYGYDGAGNRTSVQVGNGTPVSTAYDSASRPVSASDGTIYKVDEIGDLTKVTSTARTWSYSYDSWGRLTQAKNAGGTIVPSYAYDALDRLFSRTVGSAQTTYAFMGTSNALASVTSGTSATLFAEGPDGPLAQSVSGAVKAYEPDVHGDLGLIASATGISGTIAYGPWGDRRATTGEGAGSLLGFQSEPTDPDTGLVDARARWLDPLQGRFQTRDSVFGSLLDPGSLNQYAYGNDNPATQSDPNGKCADPRICPPPPTATHAERSTWLNWQGSWNTTQGKIWSDPSTQAAVNWLINHPVPAAPPLAPPITVTVHPWSHRTLLTGNPYVTGYVTQSFTVSDGNSPFALEFDKNGGEIFGGEMGILRGIGSIGADTSGSLWARLGAGFGDQRFHVGLQTAGGRSNVDGLPGVFSSVSMQFSSPRSGFSATFTTRVDATFRAPPTYYGRTIQEALDVLFVVAGTGCAVGFVISCGVSGGAALLRGTG